MVLPLDIQCLNHVYRPPSWPLIRAVGTQDFFFFFCYTSSSAPTDLQEHLKFTCKLSHLYYAFLLLPLYQFQQSRGHRKVHLTGWSKRAKPTAESAFLLSSALGPKGPLLDTKKPWPLNYLSGYFPHCCVSPPCTFITAEANAGVWDYSKYLSADTVAGKYFHSASKNPKPCHITSFH